MSLLGLGSRMRITIPSLPGMSRLRSVIPRSARNGTNAEQDQAPDEQRIREFLDCPGGVSESARSLASKLGIGRRRCRAILERLVQQGIVVRRDFADIEPMYVRFPTR
jgi:hypothetical protein